VLVIGAVGVSVALVNMLGAAARHWSLRRLFRPVVAQPPLAGEGEWPAAAEEAAAGAAAVAGDYELMR
jgi:hypothetical protein